MDIVEQELALERSRNKELEAMIKEMKQSSHKSSVSREDSGSDTET